jgi:murein DD-endopeptidase MepM/ murein hydrolase activator NlpD
MVVLELLRAYLKRIIGYLFEKVSITLIPSPKYKVRTFNIRRIAPIFLLIVIIGSISILSFLYKYYEESYIISSNSLFTLRNVEKENQELKNKLIVLNEDTEKLRNSLNELKEYNQEIRDLINVSNKLEEDKIDLQLRSVFSSNQNLFQSGLPIGGGDFHLYYQDPDELINRMENNLNRVRNELPSQQDNLKKLEKSVKDYNARLAATPVIWPVADKGEGYISSNFGWRTNPFTKKQQFHDGLDIAVWYNTPVLSTAYGKVSFTGWLNGYGWTVKIEHGYGYKTIYGHLNKIKVKKGEMVTRGQVIALSGNSGRSTGPHLHYEVRINNIPQNPRKFIGR